MIIEITANINNNTLVNFFFTYCSTSYYTYENPFLIVYLIYPIDFMHVIIFYTYDYIYM